MQHLPTDRLAALADEAPTSEERAHLALCAACAREARAFGALLAMATAEGSADGTGPLSMPLTRWESLAPALRAEGLVAGASAAPAASAAASRRRSPAVPAWAVRAAAAVVLLVGGVVGGRLSAGAPLLPERATLLAGDPKPARPIKGDRPLERATPAADEGEARLASTDGMTIDSILPASFASVEDALRWQQRFAIGYQHATAFIAQHDSTAAGAQRSPNENAARTRLAALDRAGRVMREALRDAPADPVINGYYLTTLGEREATLRQINAQPADRQRVIGF